MRTPPLDVVFSWPAPNYKNPETRGPANEAIAIFLWALSTLILVIRFYARKHITHGFGPDDVLIFIAWVPATAFGVCGLITQYKFHWDRHIWDVPSSSIVPGIQLSLAHLILFDIATSFTKLSMLALIYRLVVCSTSNRLRVTCQVMGIIISINCVVFMLVVFFQCRPFSDNWKISFTSHANCTVNEGAHLLAAGIINTLTDFIMVLLPMGVVYRFQELPRRQLLIVNMLFAVGFLACIAGVVRTYYTWVMSASPDYDSTWHAWMTWLFSAMELYIGLICASVPATKPFFSRHVPRMILSTYRSRFSKDIDSGVEKRRKGRTPRSVDLNKPLPPVFDPRGASANSPSSTEEGRRSSVELDPMDRQFGYHVQGDVRIMS